MIDPGMRLALWFWLFLLARLPGPGLLAHPVTIPGDSLTVFVFLHDDCIISRYYTITLNRIDSQYQTEHVGLVGMFPHSGITSEAMAAFGNEFQVTFPLAIDKDQKLARQFGITVMPEVAVVDEGTGNLLYRGRIDDSYVRVGKRNLHPRNPDLEDILRNWMEGRSPGKTVETQAVGCLITFNEPGNKP